MFNLSQIISEPTRITDTTCSLLDHVLCKHQNKISQSGTILIGVSDLFLTFCTRKSVKIPSKKHNIVKIRSLMNYSKEIFVYKLTSTNWDAIYLANNVNTAFKEILMEIMNHVAPIKEIKLKQSLNLGCLLKFLN
jgi:hypothetical protein